MNTVLVRYCHCVYKNKTIYKNPNAKYAVKAEISMKTKSLKFYPKLRLVSGFTLTKSTRTVTVQDVPLPNVTSGRPYAPAEVTILVREYQENYQK